MDHRIWRNACHHHALLNGTTPLLFGLTARIHDDISQASGPRGEAIRNAIQKLIDRRVLHWHATTIEKRHDVRFTKATCRAKGTAYVFRQDVFGNITVTIESAGNIIRTNSVMFPGIIPEAALQGMIGKRLGELITGIGAIIDPDRVVISRHHQKGWSKRSYLRTTSEDEIEKSYQQMIGDPEERFRVATAG